MNNEPIYHCERHVFISVGYDMEHLVLDGRFNYEKENQRTLPFNVEIEPLPMEKRMVVGSSSKEIIHKLNDSTHCGRPSASFSIIS